MKKVTKQQHAKRKELSDAVNMAMNNIYHCSSNRNTPFSECFKIADEQLRKAYDAAVYERWKFEHGLVSDGRGWFDQFGHFYSY